MKRHIEYIIYEVTPCPLGDNYRYILEVPTQADAVLFIKDWYYLYAFKNTCLVFMEVLA